MVFKLFIFIHVHAIVRSLKVDVDLHLIKCLFILNVIFVSVLIFCF